MADLDVDEVFDCALGRGEHDRPLSFHWRTPDLDAVRSLGISSIDNKHLTAARSAIITEALLAENENRWVSYSRHKPFYSGQVRYRGTAYTYTTVLRAVDELCGLGLLEEERSSPRHRGRQSRFQATPKLIAAMTDATIQYELCGLIRLKDQEGNLIDYRDTDATRRMHREIQKINAALGSVRLELPALDIIRTRFHFIVDGAYYRPTLPALYRVFNRSSFKSGGRAYGWWQSLPKARRGQLLMDSEPTAEPDFGQMHASILYAQRGHRLEGDAYETGEFPRALGKLAFNVALNAKTRSGAISALLNKSDWPLSGAETGKLLEALAHRNAPIAADLHADRGIVLMRTDSEITIGAVKRCIEVGIPALPIHDSMLTPIRHADRVIEIMEESAARILKGVNPCPVSISKPTVPQTPSGPPASSLLLLSPWATQLDLFPSAPSFSEPIRALRDRLGLSQRELGEKVGCRQPHIANVESGRDRLGDWPRRRLRDLMREAA